MIVHAALDISRAAVRCRKVAGRRWLPGVTDRHAALETGIGAGR